MSTTPEPEDLRCSFCHKSRNAVKKLIAGPLVFICDECVEVCVDILRDEGFEISGSLRRVPEANASRETLADLMNELAGLSVEDKWVMVGHLLARLQHVTLMGERAPVRK